MRKLHLIQNQQRLIEIFKEPPLISYRKGNTLKKYLLERNYEGQITNKCMSRVFLPSPIFKPGNLRCVKFDSMLFPLSPAKGVLGDPRGLQWTSIFPSPHSLSSVTQVKKSPKITKSSISPCSHNISFSPFSLHFRPDFSLLPTFSGLPVVYLPPLSSWWHLWYDTRRV